MTAMRGALAVAVGLCLALPACDGDTGDEGGRAGGDPNAVATVFPSSPLPESRTEVAGTVWGDRIAIAGGFTEDGTPSNRLDLLDEAGEWSRGPDLPAAYDHTSLVSADERLWLVGGYADGRATEAVYSLGADDDQWREEASLTEPRGALATVATAGTLVAVGGVNDSGVLATTEIYNSEAEEWTTGPELATPREHTAAAVVGDTIYAIAGRQLSLETNLTSVESLTLPDGEWVPEPDLNFSRGGTAAAGLAARPCVAGGEEPTGTIPSIECLVDGEWQVVGMLEVPRHGLAVVAVGERLHIIGGGAQPGLFVSDTHEVFEVGTQG